MMNLVKCFFFFFFFFRQHRSDSYRCVCKTLNVKITYLPALLFADILKNVIIENCEGRYGKLSSTSNKSMS